MKRAVVCLAALLLLLSACGSPEATPSGSPSSENSAWSEKSPASEPPESSSPPGALSESGESVSSGAGAQDDTPEAYRGRVLLALYQPGEPYTLPYDPELYENYPNESREGFVPENTTDFSAWTPDWDGPEEEIEAALSHVLASVGPAADLATERLVAATRLAPVSQKPPSQYKDSTTWRFFQYIEAPYVWCEEDVRSVYARLFGEDAAFDPAVLNEINVGYGYSAEPRPGFIYRNGEYSPGGVASELTGWSREDDAVCLKGEFWYTDGMGEAAGERVSVEYRFQIAEDGHLVLTGRDNR